MALGESKLLATTSQALKGELGVEVSSPSCDAALSALVQRRPAVSDSFTAALTTIRAKIGLQVGTAPHRVRAGGRLAACQGAVDMHLLCTAMQQHGGGLRDSPPSCRHHHTCCCCAGEPKLAAAGQHRNACVV